MAKTNTAHANGAGTSDPVSAAQHALNAIIERQRSLIELHHSAEDDASEARAARARLLSDGDLSDGRAIAKADEDCRRAEIRLDGLGAAVQEIAGRRLQVEQRVAAGQDAARRAAEVKRIEPLAAEFAIASEAVAVALANQILAANGLLPAIAPAAVFSLKMAEIATGLRAFSAEVSAACAAHISALTPTDAIVTDENAGLINLFFYHPARWRGADGATNSSPRYGMRRLETEVAQRAIHAGVGDVPQSARVQKEIEEHGVSWGPVNVGSTVDLDGSPDEIAAAIAKLAEPGSFVQPTMYEGLAPLEPRF